MKISILGLRGLPSSYGGYETAIRELAPRFVDRGHQVTVYCRSPLFREQPSKYLGVDLVYLPSLEHKTVSTLSHSFLSMLHAVGNNADIIFTVNAANGIWGVFPKLCGRKSVLNVDGMEWLRPKWNSIAKWFFRTSAQLGTKFYDAIITDAEEMHRLYAQQFGIDTDYIANGANIEHSVDPAVIREFGLTPNNYYLIASRLIPDNNAAVIVEGLVKSNTKKLLAIVGGADYRGNMVERKYIDQIRALADDRVKLLGHISDQEKVIELHCNAFAYIHGHQHGGINPALLKALGCGNFVLANNTPFNAEVLDNGTYGILFDMTPTAITNLINSVELNLTIPEGFRAKARQRIIERFTWERIADQHLELFQKVIGKQYR